MRAALLWLERNGFVQRKGRGFAIRWADSPPDRRSDIFVLGLPRDLHLIAPHAAPFVAAMEQELQGLTGRRLRFHLTAAQSPAALPPEHMVGGYVFLKPESFRVRQALLNAGRAIPVVVLDSAESLIIPRRSSSHIPTVRSIAFDNRYAGCEAALHLASLRHRHVAVFSHLPVSAGWIERRIEGVRRTMRSVGGETDLLQLPDTRANPGRELACERYSGPSPASGRPSWPRSSSRRSR